MPQHGPRQVWCDKCQIVHNIGQHTHRADCGRAYEHDPHLYLTEKLHRAKACDGSTTKRT